VRIEVFSLGFGPVLFSRRLKGTQYNLSLVPLGGFVKLAGDNAQEYQGRHDEFLSRPLGQRAAIIFWGPLVNYLCGFLCLWLIFFIGYPSLTTKVGEVMDGFGAKEAGIVPGDKVISIDARPVRLWEELQVIVQAKPALSRVSLVILRDNQEIAKEVLIKEKQADDIFGQRHKIGLLGLAPEGETVKTRHGLLSSFFLGLIKTRDWTLITAKALWGVFSGRISLRESVTGPLGLFYVTSKAASAGLVALLHLVAILNINLAIFNLLPLPILDGGHILLLGLEKLRKKGLGVQTERLISRVGFAFMLTLIIVVTYNDIIRFFLK
jgi:regulator of sigma E protease